MRELAGGQTAAAVIERELYSYQARPHWGKLFTMSPADVRSKYERMPKFTKLATKYDPNGKWRSISGCRSRTGRAGCDQARVDIQPAYTVRQYVYANLPLAQMKDHFDEIQAKRLQRSLFTDSQKQRVSELWIKVRDGHGKPFTGPPEYFGATLAARNMNPIANLSAENCIAQMGVPGPWYEPAALPHGVHAQRGQGTADGILTAPT